MVIKLVDGAVTTNRKHDPGFLMVPPAVEKTLKAGARIEDSTERIDVAVKSHLYTKQAA